MSHNHRAAVRLSRVDREKVATGKLGSETEALHQALTEETGDAASHTSGAEFIEPRDARERQMLEDLPPHFGKL